MKSNRILILAALALSCAPFAGCREDEAPLTPSEIVSMSRFEFPEGDGEVDRIFADIYERFGIQVIYRNWTMKDWEKSWTNPSGGLSGGNMGFKFESGPQTDTLLLAAEFVRDHVFAHLDTELTGRIFPQYIYLVNSFATIMASADKKNYFATLDVTMGKHGIDFIICSPLGNPAFYSSAVFPPRPVNAILDPAPDLNRIGASFLWRMYFFEGLKVKKVFAYPDNFMPEIDFKKPLSTINPDDPDYFLTRGFIKTTNSSYSIFYLPPPDEPAKGPENLFDTYVMTALYYSEQEVINLYGAYPLAMKAYEYVVGYVKDNYGCDLKAIAAQRITKTVE